jgi:hypothetical protein
MFDENIHRLGTLWEFIKNLKKGRGLGSGRDEIV